MVNIEELSAKELYELAKKKEQEEARLAQIQEQLKALEEEKKDLIQRHQDDLAEADRKIEELTRNRERMIEGHQKALSILEQKLKKLGEEAQDKKEAAAAATPEKAPEAKQEQAPAAPAKAPEPKPATPAPAKAPEPVKKESLVGEDLPPPSDEENGDSGKPQGKQKGRSDGEELDELLDHLQKIMKGRSYISDSLLREKLQAAKFKPANLSKLLDTLVRQAKLVRRSGGNYVLGRMAKKK